MAVPWSVRVLPRVLPRVHRSTFRDVRVDQGPGSRAGLDVRVYQPISRLRVRIRKRVHGKNAAETLTRIAGKFKERKGKVDALALSKTEIVPTSRLLAIFVKRTYYFQFRVPPKASCTITLARARSFVVRPRRTLFSTLQSG